MNAPDPLPVEDEADEYQRDAIAGAGEPEDGYSYEETK